LSVIIFSIFSRFRSLNVDLHTFLFSGSTELTLSGCAQGKYLTGRTMFLKRMVENKNSNLRPQSISKPVGRESVIVNYAVDTQPLGKNNDLLLEFLQEATNRYLNKPI